MDSNVPTLSKITISMSTWIFMYLGLITLRAELHPWVNTIILTVVYPMYIWFMSKNNVLSLISRGSIIATVIAAVLFMTLLLEAMPKSNFSQMLKKSVKSYGKNPKDTALASFFVAMSIAIGFVVSYMITGKTFIGD